MPIELFLEKRTRKLSELQDIAFGCSRSARGWGAASFRLTPPEHCHTNYRGGRDRGTTASSVVVKAKIRYLAYVDCGYFWNLVELPDRKATLSSRFGGLP